MTGLNLVKIEVKIDDEQQQSYELASQVCVPPSQPWHDFSASLVLICAHSGNFEWMAGQLKTLSHDKCALRAQL